MSHGWELDRGSPHWIYRYWRADGRCLYVGVTRTPQERHKQHAWYSAWFKDIDRYELLPVYPSGRSAYAAEREFILQDLPLFNLKDNPATKEIRLPYGSWMLPAKSFSALLYEIVREREAADLASTA